LYAKYPDNPKKLFEFFKEINEYLFGSKNIIVLQQKSVFDEEKDKDTPLKYFRVKPFRKYYKGKPDLLGEVEFQTSDILCILDTEFDSGKLRCIQNECEFSKIKLKKFFYSIYNYKTDCSMIFYDPQSQTALNMYDERGFDIISKDKEFLKEIYNKFSSWILDYNRREIIKKLGI
jgi:hypothetical protein